MENMDIRLKMTQFGIRYWQLADAVGISQSSLCAWMRRPLTDERRDKILPSIEKLRLQHQQEA